MATQQTSKTSKENTYSAGSNAGKSFKQNDKSKKAPGQKDEWSRTSGKEPKTRREDLEQEFDDIDNEESEDAERI